MIRGKLKVFRKTFGITQEEMAAKLGISKNHYGNIENGVFDPSYEVMKEFADKFNREYGRNLDVWGMFQKDDESTKKITVIKDPTFIEDVKVKTDWRKK